MLLTEDERRTLEQWARRPKTAERLALRAQALDRTRPLLPMRPGIPAHQTHAYIRHGTTSLFAALEVATGKAIGQCHRRHRHQEFLTFLDRVDAQLPPDRDVHVIMDNYGTHKAPKVIRCSGRRVQRVLASRSVSRLRRRGPSSCHGDKIVSVLLPVVERLGIKVGAVGPLDRPERRIEINGIEETQVP